MLFCSFLLSAVFHLSASNLPDSLFQKETKGDTYVVNTEQLISQSQLDYNLSFDSTISLIEQFKNNGQLLYNNQNYDQAVELFLKALSMIDELNLSITSGQSTRYNRMLSLSARIKAMIANVYADLHNHKVALEYYLSSYDDYKRLNDTTGIQQSLNGIGLTLNYMQKTNEALEVFDTLLTIALRSNDSSFIANTYNNRGLVLVEMGAFYTALVNFNRALDFYKNLGDKKRMAVCYMNLGYVQGRLGDFDSIPVYYNKSLDMLRQIKDEKGIVKVQIDLAQYYFMVDRLRTSKEYLDSAFTLARKHGFKEFMININYYYSEIFAKSGDFKNAYLYQQEYVSKRDSLYRAGNEKITSLRVEYETEKRDRINRLLKQDNKIKELMINRKQNLQFFLIILILLLIGIAFLIYSRYRLKIRISKQLQQQKHQLEVANATKDRFFSIIAHDLKNPISAARSFAEMLSARYHNLSDEKRISMTQNIKKSTDLTYSLLENLLNWAMSQTGRLKYNPCEINLKAMVEETSQVLMMQAGNKNVSVEIDIPDDIIVLADRDLLLAVIRNLVSNAIKFSEAGGKVQIKAIRKSNQVIVSVKDDGIGISAEDQKKLFRIDCNTSSIGRSKEKGTGLGLILCKDFVEKNGGKIWLESSAGKGSIFNFTLNLADKHETN